MVVARDALQQLAQLQLRAAVVAAVAEQLCAEEVRWNHLRPGTEAKGGTKCEDQMQPNYDKARLLPSPSTAQPLSCAHCWGRGARDQTCHAKLP